MPVSESDKNVIYNLAQKFKEEVRQGKHRPNHSINDTISKIEHSRDHLKPPTYRATNTYYFKCFTCRAHVVGGFDLNGCDVAGKSVPACPSCGKPPHDLGQPDIAAPNVMDDIKPFFEVSLGADARGAVYVPGQGHMITSKAHLREFARANGHDYR